MAEILTYDAGTDTVTTEDNLTADEQDSLRVGEAMQENEESLLAGKYKNAEDLEKAYVELSKKLGEKSTEDSETTRDSDESDDTKETSEEEEETSEDSPALSLIHEASTEYYENDGQLKPETLEKFNSMSSQDLVNAYIQSQKNNPPAEATPDLTDSDINTVRNSVGGQAEYDKIVNWAGQNLPKSDVDSFDQLVSTGNVGAIKLAITGLKAQYENANGFEGDMVSGKPAKRSSDVFRSQAELVAAMSDPRYENDPAYRQDVVDKLERSNVNF